MPNSSKLGMVAGQAEMPHVHALKIMRETTILKCICLLAVVSTDRLG